MKKILELKQMGGPERAKKMYLPFGNNHPWWIHRLSDGTHIFEHWSRHHVLSQRLEELVVMRIGNKRGVPMSRMVNIIV